MAFVIVEDVYDSDAAANELAERGQSGRAEEVRQRGAGTFVMTDPADLGSDRERATSALAMWRETRPAARGLRLFLRLDFDPDWRIQHFAVREALREVPALRERSAVPALNAFTRAYYGRDARWDVPDHGDGRWPQTDARNFVDHAYLLANALGGLRLVDAGAPQPYVLATAARTGWDLAEVQGMYVCAELWLAYSLGRALRQCGEDYPEGLSQAILRGSEGNS